jgi:hypothetical protein
VRRVIKIMSIPSPDFENKAHVTGLFQGDNNELIPCENVEIGFSDSEIKELAEEISNKLIVLVKNQLEK